MFQFLGLVYGEKLHLRYITQANKQ